MRTIEAIVLVLAYGAVAFASLSEPSLRPDAGFESGNIDHFFAYLVLGALTAWIHGNRLQTRWLLILIPLYAGLLELGQLLVPGRHATIENFLASVIGAWAGVVIGKAARRLGRQYLTF